MKRFVDGEAVGPYDCAFHHVTTGFRDVSNQLTNRQLMAQAKENTMTEGHPIPNLMHLTAKHHQRALRNFRMEVRLWLQTTFGFEPGTDWLELYAHGPAYPEHSTSPLHWHIRVNIGVHYTEFSRSFMLDQIIHEFEKHGATATGVTIAKQLKVWVSETPEDIKNAKSSSETFLTCIENVIRLQDACLCDRIGSSSSPHAEMFLKRFGPAMQSICGGDEFGLVPITRCDLDEQKSLWNQTGDQQLQASLLDQARWAITTSRDDLGIQGEQTCISKHDWVVGIVHSSSNSGRTRPVMLSNLRQTSRSRS